MDSIEANKLLVRRFFAAVENGDFAVFDEVVAENYDDHLPGQSPGRETLKHYFQGLRAAFPDIRLPISQLIAEGDRVAVLNAVQGTHRGEFLGIAPTGRTVDAPAFQMYRIQDGQLAEHWEVADFATLLKQLNARA
jgi:steroid delta-isomerase-like uncharacterized protein